MEESIKKDIINIINMIKKCHSKSMYNSLISDLDKLYTLAHILNIEVLNVDDFSYKNYPFNFKKIEKKQKNFYLNNYDFNKELVNNYQDILSVLNPVAYYELPVLSDTKIQELIKESLLSYDRKIYNLYNKYNDRIIYLNELDMDGLTFYGNFFEPYILIEKENTIFTCLKLIHELGHVYDFSNSQEKRYNYTGEIYSHFNELVFYDCQYDILNSEIIKKNYLYSLRESICELEELLNSNINTNEEFRNNYSKIYYNLEYTYGMILALEFYNEYDFSFKKGINLITSFSYNKNYIKDIFDLIDKYDFDINDIKKGKTLKSILL